MTRTPREPSYRKRLGYHAGLLGGIALLASTALVIGNMRTRDDIAARLAEDMQASLQQVIPQGLYDNDLLQDQAVLPIGPDPKQVVKIYRARQADKVEAVAYQVTGQGYAGAIDLIMGVDREGKLLGVRVIAHSETPGLGDKMETAKSDWILSFDGRSLSDPVADKWKVKKDGGTFDQFTGATITPRAIVRAIREGLALFQHHRAELLDEASKTGAKPPPRAALVRSAVNEN